jgi:hypothetical protein
MASEELQRFLTDEQYAEILVDRALFSDSYSVRTRSVKQLSLEYYRPKAKRMIEDIIDSTPVTDYIFRAFCRNVIDAIDKHDETR